MNKFKENKGITIISLIIIIIVMCIVAGITLKQGTTLIKQVNVDNYKTNMISIKAKSKVIAEEVNSKVWDIPEEEKLTKRQEIYETEYGMKKTDFAEKQIEGLDSNIGTEYECYIITEQTLKKMGLSDIDKIEDYVIVYNLQDYTLLDVVYKPGIKYNEKTYYTLSNLQAEMGE